MLEKCVLIILELNWKQRLGHKKTKLNICHHMLTSSTQLQKGSFHVCRKNENVFKMSKNEICSCKACKNTFFHCRICKFVGFLLPSSLWLLQVPFCVIQTVIPLQIMTEWLGSWAWILEIPSFQFPLWSPAGFVSGSPWFNCSVALVRSQLVCLLPVGILFQRFDATSFCFNRHAFRYLKDKT